MAPTRDMADYLCDQLRDAGEIRCKKMFGEFGLYCDGIYFGCICDNQLFIKPTATNVELLEHPEGLCALVRRTCAELPRKKPRKT